jgi:hypothetical protein
MLILIELRLNPYPDNKLHNKHLKHLKHRSFSATPQIALLG